MKLYTLLFLTTLLSSHATTIIFDSGSFSVNDPNLNGTSLGVVETSTFSLTSDQIVDTFFESNFTTIDAGIIITVNGQVLLDTGDDVSQFRAPSAFTPTINDPFDLNGNVNGIPRLTISSDSLGTTFSGSPDLNSTQAVAYTANFPVADFTSLLQTGTNTIEIINQNGFEGAALIGDFTVGAVPEPATGAFAILGAVTLLVRRKR